MTEQHKAKKPMMERHREEIAGIVASHNDQAAPLLEVIRTTPNGPIVWDAQIALQKVRRAAHLALKEAVTSHIAEANAPVDEVGA